jgi:polyribonucleotide nucleotidyltransferase
MYTLYMHIHLRRCICIFIYIFIYIIGPKGKTVQTMIEQYGLVNINLEDTGSVQIESFSYEKNEEVKEVCI